MRASYWDFTSGAAKILADKNVTPKQVAPLRAASRVLRTMLEVFAPLLPSPKNDGKGKWLADIWDMMANDLDSGTAALYAFENLGSPDDPPSKAELDKHWDRILKWQTKWDKNNLKYDYSGYVESMSTNTTFSHWAQSEFFWRDRAAPLPDDAGMRAVLVLVKDQIHAVSHLATDIMTLKSMHSSTSHALASRFYSACSAVLDESIAFGKGLFVPSSPTASALKALEELTADYFVMEGLYHDWRHAAKGVDPKKTAKLLDALDKTWAKLAVKQDKLNMPALLSVLLLSLSSPC